MSEQDNVVRRSWTRREVIGTTAAAAVVSLSPLSQAIGAALPQGTARRLATDWDIDDVWTGYPRYAASIGYARARAVPADPLEHL